MSIRPAQWHFSVERQHKINRFKCLLAAHDLYLTSPHRYSLRLRTPAAKMTKELAPDANHSMSLLLHCWEMDSGFSNVFISQSAGIANKATTCFRYLSVLQKMVVSQPQNSCCPSSEDVCMMLLGRKLQGFFTTTMMMRYSQISISCNNPSKPLSLHHPPVAEVFHD